MGMAVCVESRSIGLCWCRNVVTFMIVSSFLINFSTGELQSNNDSEGCRQDRGEGSCAGGSLTGADGSRQQDLSSQTSSSHHAAGKESIPDVEWSRPSAGACPADHLVSSAPCVDLPANCLSCRFNRSCVYGSDVSVLCQPATSTKCSGNRLFNRTMRCAYCYQTPSWQHDCSLCNVMMRGKKYYRANCTVQEDVLCMGRRTFHKSLFCKWTKGDRWSTALTLSIILGGFGVDRFYLGHWQEGIGKFFSFGGLGVWTLIDVVLIAIGYLSPADGSLYIT